MQPTLIGCVVFSLAVVCDANWLLASCGEYLHSRGTSIVGYNDAQALNSVGVETQPAPSSDCKNGNCHSDPASSPVSPSLGVEVRQRSTQFRIPEFCQVDGNVNWFLIIDDSDLGR